MEALIFFSGVIAGVFAMCLFIIAKRIETQD